MPRKKTRVCGKTCHNAKGAKCRCWCGGLFHGHAGADNRERFASEFNLEKIPTTERGFQETTGQPDLFGDGLGAGDTWRRRREERRTV